MFGFVIGMINVCYLVLMLSGISWGGDKEAILNVTVGGMLISNLILVAGSKNLK